MASESNNQKFVPESALIELLPAFSDYTYDRHEPRYPYEIPGVSSMLLEPPKANNCCTAFPILCLIFIPRPTRRTSLL